MKFEPIRTLKYYFLKITRLQGEPSFIARGVAAGIFIGITPTIPLHTFLAILLAFVCRGSKIAALLASLLVSNPLTIFFQYYLSWLCGNFITGGHLSWEKINAILETIASDIGFQESLAALSELSQQTIVTMLIGGAFLALPFTVLGYFITLNFFTAIRNKKQHSCHGDGK